jgi:hypothetical protein
MWTGRSLFAWQAAQDRRGDLGAPERGMECGIGNAGKEEDGKMRRRKVEKKKT